MKYETALQVKGRSYCTEIRNYNINSKVRKNLQFYQSSIGSFFNCDRWVYVLRLYRVNVARPWYGLIHVIAACFILHVLIFSGIYGDGRPRDY
jgi:hypothetical protein